MSEKTPPETPTLRTSPDEGDRNSAVLPPPPERVPANPED